MVAEAQPAAWEVTAAPVVRVARPMVWGTNNYRNLWAAAMQLGERQEAEGADAAEVSTRARRRAR